MPTNKPFELSYVGPCMEEWRRLSGLPPERAEVPNFGGPGLEEIAARQAQEHEQLKREIAERLHAATVPMPPQKRKRRRPDDWMKEAVRASGVSYASVPVPDQCPRVGERVLVRIPDGLTANGMQGGGVYQGIVESTEGDLVRVRIPDIENRVFVQSMSQLIREVVEAIPMDRKQATAPCPFRVGDRVRVARGSGKHSFADRVGVVDVVLEGPRQCDVRFPTIMNRTYGFKWDDLDMWEMRTLPMSKKEAQAVLERRNANSCSMLPVWIDPATMPQETWAATLELAGGRLVEVPAPDPAIWELEEERRWEAEEGVRVHVAMAASRETDVALKYARPVTDPHWGGGVCMLGHDAARCWAHDMARIVNAQGPVGMDQKERGALLRSLRSYRRRPPVDPHADRAYPTLRAYLW